MIHAKVTSKGQITIPAEMRAKLRLKPGSRVTFVEQPDGSYLVRAKTGDIRELRGIVPKPPKPVSIEDMNQAVVEEVVKRFLESTR